jgi:phosphatidylglycerophosphate synthase
VTDVSNSPSTVAARPRMVILVTGRTAVARVGGISAIRRHVETAKRLGLDPLVLYPARMTALGAEIDAELDGSVVCAASDSFAHPDQLKASEPEGDLEDSALSLGAAKSGIDRIDDEDFAIVVAADWFISPSAVYAFGAETSGDAVARFQDRGRIVAPMARLRTGVIRDLLPEITTHPVSELINRACPSDATIVELPQVDRHRLSDNIAIERCERKLFGLRSERRDSWLVRLFERWLAIPLARRLARTPITPMQVSISKIVIGCFAARILASDAPHALVAGALVYFASRILDAVAGDLSRAAVRPGSQGDKIDVIGDLIVHLAIVWTLAARADAGQYAWVAAAITTAGLAISGRLVYLRVLKLVWSAANRSFGARHPVRSDNFATRFSRANGPAYALIAAAIIGRPDLFLWATAITSHLFYIAWLRDERRAADR